MYLIIKIVGENCTPYDRQTEGKEFIDTCQNLDEFKEIISKKHEPDFFEQPNGTVTDQQGEEIYSLENPDFFSYGDFVYNCWKASEIDIETLYGKQIIKAVEKYSPHNLTEIMRIVYNDVIDCWFDSNMNVQAVFVDEIVDALDRLGLVVRDYDTQFDDDDDMCIISVQADSLEDMQKIVTSIRKLGHKFI
jgi:hypothetical protein